MVAGAPRLDMQAAQAKAMGLVMVEHRIVGGDGARGVARELRRLRLQELGQGLVADQTVRLGGVLRGGSGVVYDNISSQSPCCQDPYPGAQFGPDCPSSDQCTGSWPIPTQVGTGIHETTTSPVYVWGNSRTIDGSMQSIQDGLGYTNGTQAGPTPTSCSHPGNVCDVVVTAVAPSSWVRCESAADVSAGCPVPYTYRPYPYPHPLDDLATMCFGAGCAVEKQPDSGAAADSGASQREAGPRDGGSNDGGTSGGGVIDGRSADGGSSTSGANGGCGCRVPARSRATKTDSALLVALGSVIVAFSRRRARRRETEEEELTCAIRSAPLREPRQRIAFGPPTQVPVNFSVVPPHVASTEPSVTAQRVSSDDG